MIFHSRGVELPQPNLEVRQMAEFGLRVTADSNPNRISNLIDLMRFGGLIGSNLWLVASSKAQIVLDDDVPEVGSSDLLAKIVGEDTLNYDPIQQKVWGVSFSQKGALTIGSSGEYITADLYPGSADTLEDSQREWRVRVPLGQLAVKDIEDISSFALQTRAGGHTEAYYPFDITSQTGLQPQVLRGFALGLKRAAEYVLDAPDAGREV